MEEVLVSAEEFFGSTGKGTGDFSAPVYAQEDLDAFEKVKIEMVMKLNKCEREKAIELIKERKEEHDKAKEERRKRHRSPFDD